MSEKKEYSDEMMKKYISSEIEIIDKKRKDRKNWNINKNYKNQIIMTEGTVENVSSGTNAEF